MKAAIALFVFALIHGGFGPEAIADTLKNELKRGIDSIVSPGELSKAHRLKEINDCKKCHEYYGEIHESKCFSCHKIIQKRRESGIGYHGKKKKEQCIHCHKEHPGAAGSIIHFDKEKFDHTVADFPLEGKHKEAKCEKCHTRKRSDDGNNPAGYYLGLRHDACLDCHKDPHKGSFDQKRCDTCHTPAGWRGKELKFAHDRDTKFRLEGKHQTIECVKCHKATTKDGLLDVASFRTKHDICSDCHKDPHKGCFGQKKCDTCHVPAGWKGNELKFAHDRDARFRLEGKHQTVKCVKCHTPRTPGAALSAADFKGLKFDLCSDCHKDPHRGEIKTACPECHSAQGWRGKDLKFDHRSNIKFKLEGKHQTVKCAKCHKATTKDGLMDVASFRLKHESCPDCHKDPHRGEIKASCPECHSVQGWRGRDQKFDHRGDSKFKLEGKHQTVKCVKCHKASTKDGSLDVASFKTKHESCTNCHHGDPHKGSVVPKKCEDCHTPAGWRGKGLKFEHNRDARFRLEGKHKPLQCIKCHKATTKEGLMDVASFKIDKPEMCTACHKYKHKGTFVVACQRCHGFDSWKRQIASSPY
jgi:hypothetical protein